MEVYISWSSNEYIMCTVPCIVTIEVVAMEQCCASCFFSSSESRRQPNSYLFFEFWRKRLKFPLKKVGGGGDNKNPNTKYY